MEELVQYILLTLLLALVIACLIAQCHLSLGFGTLGQLFSRLQGTLMSRKMCYQGIINSYYFHLG